MEESHLIRKEPCPKCGSRDNLARYSDGHAYCFGEGCGYREKGDGEAVEQAVTNTPKAKSLTEYFEGTCKPLKARGITEDTCRLFGVRVGRFKGSQCHFYPYYKDGQVVAAKVRGQDKDFTFAGEAKNPPMFGQNLWSGGKKIVVTEGEIDCLTVSQIQGNKWPVVSVPNGAGGAKKDMARQLEFFNGFEEIVLMFDMDDPGQKAAKACAELFSPGKVKIASLPLKDPNECLMAGKSEEIIKAIWNAKPYRPDGLVTVADLVERLKRPIEKGLPWFLPSLTNLTYGRRWGEIYAFGAGTGIGKTDFLTQQIAYDIVELGQKVGLVFLEQQPEETVIRVAGKLAGKRFHVPDGSWSSEERDHWIQKLGGSVTLYDSWGETDWQVVKAKIRYMAHADGIRIFYVDHLTAMADTQDEKGSLEQIMKEMAGLANELKIIIHFVSHLTAPEKGPSHEEGGHVAIRHFKGSRSIGFWSYFMFGLERNQQHEDAAVRSITTFRVLKDRYTGQATGEVIKLCYDKDSGRLSEAPKFDDETQNEDADVEF